MLTGLALILFAVGVVGPSRYEVTEPVRGECVDPILIGEGLLWLNVPAEFFGVADEFLALLPRLKVELKSFVGVRGWKALGPFACIYDCWF